MLSHIPRLTDDSNYPLTCLSYSEVATAIAALKFTQQPGVTHIFKSLDRNANDLRIAPLRRIPHSIDSLAVIHDVACFGSTRPPREIGSCIFAMLEPGPADTSKYSLGHGMRLLSQAGCVVVRESFSVGALISPKSPIRLSLECPLSAQPLAAQRLAASAASERRKC
jgi:hypothetical protein